jgi:hypothetical protein
VSELRVRVDRAGRRPSGDGRGDSRADSRGHYGEVALSGDQEVVEAFRGAGCRSCAQRSRSLAVLERVGFQDSAVASHQRFPAAGRCDGMVDGLLALVHSRSAEVGQGMQQCGGVVVGHRVPWTLAMNRSLIVAVAGSSKVRGRPVLASATRTSRSRLAPGSMPSR